MFNRAPKQNSVSPEQKSPEREKTNKEIYDEGGEFLDSKTEADWKKYFTELGREKDIIERGIAMTEQQKKNHASEVRAFNDKIRDESETLRALIFEISTNVPREDRVKTTFLDLEKKLNIIGRTYRSMLISAENANKYDPNGENAKNEVIMEDEPQKANTEVIEIKEPSYEEIEEQIRAIENIIKDHKVDYVENVLSPMKERYLKEKEPRLKQLLGRELEKTVGDVVREIEIDIDNTPDSDYNELVAAKSDLIGLRDEVKSIYSSVESEKSNVA